MYISGFVVKVSFLWVEGMALFPFVLCRSKAPDPILLNHERIHLMQQLEMGIVLFYLWYLVEYVIGFLRHQNHYQAYRQISFEREAFFHEEHMDYLRRRPYWGFLRFLKER